MTRRSATTGYSKRWANLLANKEAQFEFAHLSVLGHRGGGWDFPNWVQGIREALVETSGSKRAGRRLVDGAARSCAEHAENAQRVWRNVSGDITEQYQISYIELNKELRSTRSATSSRRSTVKGVRLDVFDLVNALLKPKGLQLKHMWRDAAQALELRRDRKDERLHPAGDDHPTPESTVHRNTCIFCCQGQEKTVRDPDGTRRKEILIRDVAEFEMRWNAAVDALEDAIKVLRHPQEYGAVGSAFFPMSRFCRCSRRSRTHVENTSAPARQLDAQRKLRHWYWASVFNNRYSGSVESTSARDFLDLKAWFDDDAAEPA